MLKPTLLALALTATPAFGGQILQGDHIMVFYDDFGNWNWDDYTAGFQVLDLDTSTWIDVTYPGTPWTLLALEYDQGGTAYSWYSLHSSGSNLTVDAAADLSSEATLSSFHAYSAGDLEIVKTETWDAAGWAVALELEVTNHGSGAVTDLRLVHALDPDQDYETWGTTNTLNDVADLSGDGDGDWVESVGPTSGLTVGYGLCDLTDEVGHTDWSTDADAAFADQEQASNDHTMHWRHTERRIAPGGTAVFGVVFAVGADVYDARDAYEETRHEACDHCDADGDGHWRVACGGDDCDDGDAGVTVFSFHPDDDGDGYGATGEGVHGCDTPAGHVDNDLDCDDTDPGVHPGADEYCDGVDTDCNGTLDDDYALDATRWYMDHDGDGYGDVRYTLDACDLRDGWCDNLDDCDDLDATVWPGAPEVCDETDNDCDGFTDDEDVGLDESTASTWYPDDDGDGWGDSSTAERRCAPPSGWVDTGGDCDDGDADAWPGAPGWTVDCEVEDVTGCSCSGAPTPATGVLLLPLLALGLRRRRR